ncbi:Hyp domain-containing protein 2, partial [Dimargaris cristalligena]
LPAKPEVPSSDMCCMSGCARCVWDIYNDELHEFEQSLETVQKAFREAGQPL